jgi:hypothetical protein
MTGAVPVVIMSRTSAAALERSIILAATKGPRSFTRTVTRRLFCLLVTVRIVPKGKVGWAAVKRLELKISPEAVGLPSNSLPYQEAIPSCRNCSTPGVWAAENATIPVTINIIKIALFILELSARHTII